MTVELTEAEWWLVVASLLVMWRLLEDETTANKASEIGHKIQDILLYKESEHDR